jgi:acyl-coenzyme A thioesterase PaaI-like protein
MEKLVELNVDEFKSKYFKILSPYFNNLFSDYFKKIVFERKNEKTGYFIFDVQFDEKCANPLNIAHGGALATLMENLATVSLYYFVNQRYKTLDISVNYKNQVELNQIFQVHIKCEKIGFTTSFVEVEVRKGGEVCTQASIIKAKIDQHAKF